MKKILASLLLALGFVSLANAQMIEKEVPSPFKKTTVRVKDGHDTYKYPVFKCDYELDTTDNAVNRNIVNAIEFRARQLEDQILYTKCNSRKAEAASAREYQDELSDLMSLNKLYGTQPERQVDIKSVPWSRGIMGFNINAGFASRMLFGSLAKASFPSREFSIAARIYIQDFYIEPFFNLGYATVRPESGFQGASLGDSLFNELLGLILASDKNRQYTAGKNSLTYSVGGRVGYNFFQNSYLRTGAFVGLGKDQFTFAKGGLLKYSGFALSEGLTCEYKIHRWVNLEQNQIVEPIVQLSLYTGQMFDAQKKGVIPTLNLGLSISLDFRSVEKP